MEYRKLGKYGLRVSQFSFGSWVTFGRQMDLGQVKANLKYAFDQGINFFDNAEVYANGQAEELMGRAFRDLGLPRQHYVLSTKFFWGIEDRINLKNSLNRKYLMQAITGSLQRLGLEHVDIAYCHRPDPETPIEETVMAMHDMVQRGYALYWGTSEWTARQIEQAYDFALANGFHRPVVEQPQYNLIRNQNVEKDLAPLYTTMGLGLTIWSPLASGLLTGKYANGVPPESRLAMKSMGWLREELERPEVQRIIKELHKLSESSKISMTHLALGWCTLNPNVSTVILGASHLDQLKENLRTLEVLPHIRALKKELDQLSALSGR